MQRSLSFIFLGLTLVTAMHAQNDQNFVEADGAFGYTSVDYDPSTNTVSIYAETSIGSDGSYYNGVTLESLLTDATTGQQLGHTYDDNPNCQSDLSVGEAINTFSCSFSASPGDTYQGRSEHGLSMQVSDPVEGGGSEEYYDADGYSTFADDPLSSPFGEEYDPPYFEATTREVNTPLGATYDSAAANAPATCGDVRDDLITEYTTYKAAYAPNCGDFTTPTAWDADDNGEFAFSQLTVYQTTGAGQFAVLQTYFGNYLTAVFNNLGNSPTINSAYRNPKHAYEIGHYDPTSRHMAGDAVDLATGSDQPTWTRQHDVGLSKWGCVEPQYKSHIDHVHIDWRTFGTGDFAGPAKCPPAYSK